MNITEQGNNLMKDTSNMTLREIAEYSKNIRITQGGLSMLLEKIILEIEALQSQVKELKR